MPNLSLGTMVSWSPSVEGRERFRPTPAPRGGKGFEVSANLLFQVRGKVQEFNPHPPPEILAFFPVFVGKDHLAGQFERLVFDGINS